MFTKTSIKAFWNDESGEATVEWVMLPLAAAVSGMVVVNVISGGINAVANSIDTQTTSALEQFRASGTPSSAPATAAPGTNTTPVAAGNPGNNKAKGRAGEAPNGQGGWGSGDRGRSR